MRSSRSFHKTGRSIREVKSAGLVVLPGPPGNWSALDQQRSERPAGAPASPRVRRCTWTAIPGRPAVAQGMAQKAGGCSVTVQVLAPRVVIGWAVKDRSMTAPSYEQLVAL